MVTGAQGGLLHFFSNNSVRDARSRQATQDLSRIEKSRERDKENPEINLPKKIPYYSGVSQEVTLYQTF